MKKNLDVSCKKNLVITNILCQSLDPSLYGGSTFIFQKVGGGGGLAPPAPPPARALINDSNFFS